MTGLMRRTRKALMRLSASYPLSPMRASGLDLGGERLGLRHVVDLTAGETNGERQAERVDDDVDFCGQSAARSADRFLAAVFLGAPALC